MMQRFFNNIVMSFDAPKPWGIYFQDTASPQMEALVELHDNIMFYLVIVLFGVAWILLSIIRNYVYNKSPISNKYLNHGKYVPIQKYSNSNTQKRYYTNTKISETNHKPSLNLDEKDSNIEQIIKENNNKSGIYLITNLITNDQYVGQSIDLGKIFRKYFTLSYLKNRNSLVISRALIKYGYANFSISILEYCDVINLNNREQHYMDKLKPVYNTLKVAGSSSGYKHTQESKDKRSRSLEGVYVGTKSLLYGKTHTPHGEETKNLMSSKRKGADNNFYNKSHTDETKKIIRQKALNRKHSSSTLENMAKVKGNPVNIYEKSSYEDFKLIGSLVSARRAGLLLGISGSTVIKYMHSGEIFKDRYKFSSR